MLPHTLIWTVIGTAALITVAAAWRSQPLLQSYAAAESRAGRILAQLCNVAVAVLLVAYCCMPEATLFGFNLATYAAVGSLLFIVGHVVNGLRQ